MPLNNLAKEREQLLSDKAVLIFNYNKLEKALLDVSKLLEFVINATETGNNRNLLTYANIIALNAIK